jgi:ABC-type lipoprotein export system ATPase subunit
MSNNENKLSDISTQENIGFNKKVNLDKIEIDKNGLKIIIARNGAGKSQVLNYLYKSLIRKETIFRTTPKDITKSSNYPLRFREERLYNYEPNSIHDIDGLLENLRRALQKHYNTQEKSDIFNRLFSNQDHYYQNERFKVIEKINSFLEEQEILNKDDLERFKQQIGYPTQREIDRKCKDIYKTDHHPNRKKETEVFLDQYNAYKNSKDFENTEKKAIENIKEEIQKNKEYTIKDETKFIEFFETYLTMPYMGIMHIIKHLEEKINTDYYLQKPKGETSLYEEINKFLKENNDFNKAFKYELGTPPQKYSTYELTFRLKDKPNTSLITFNKLSTGEQSLFELIAYKYLIKKNNKNQYYKYILLDEFDANLDYHSIKTYMAILHELAESYKIVITTHQPMTVHLANDEEVLYLDREQSELQSISKDEAVSKIIPEYISFNVLVSIGYLFASKKPNIILVEGEDDKYYMEKARKDLNIEDKYEFIDCKGAGNIPHLTTALYATELSDNIKDKKILALFDFDKAGKTHLNKIQKLKEENKRERKYYTKLDNPNCNNIFMALLPVPESLQKYYSCEDKNKGYTIEHLFDEVRNNRNISKGDVKNKVENNEYKMDNFKELFEYLDMVLELT